MFAPIISIILSSAKAASCFVSSTCAFISKPTLFPWLSYPALTSFLCLNYEGAEAPRSMILKVQEPALVEQ